MIMQYLSHSLEQMEIKRYNHSGKLIHTKTPFIEIRVTEGWQNWKCTGLENRRPSGLGGSSPSPSAKQYLSQKFLELLNARRFIAAKSYTNLNTVFQSIFQFIKFSIFPSNKIILSIIKMNFFSKSSV